MTSEMEQFLPLAVPAATIFAAAIAGLAGYLAGGWKLREVTLSYAQRVRDSYLDNARTVSVDVYIPLSVAISRLTTSYFEFRLHINFEEGSAPDGAVNRFKGASRKFQAIVADLMERGASAYLTLALEEEINEFVLFLENSIPATTTSKKLTLSPRFRGLLSQPVSFSGGSSFSILANTLRFVTMAFSLAIPFARIELSVHEKTVASPITSRDFERQFRRSTLTISSLIKEVTLGSRIAPA